MLPLPASLLAFTVVSIVAIWAAVYLFALPRSPSALLVAACCGAFAICLGAGEVTLLLGQPTGFIAAGLAIMYRA